MPCLYTVLLLFLHGFDQILIICIILYSRRKSPPLTYKLSATFGQWVVKFNPLGSMGPWYDVKKENGILQGLHSDLPVPKPIYAGANADEWMVGTAFIIVELVKVCVAELYTILALIFNCIIVICRNS